MSKHNAVIWYKPKTANGKDSKNWKRAAILLDKSKAEWELARFKRANPGVKFHLGDDPPGPREQIVEKNIPLDL